MELEGTSFAKFLGYKRRSKMPAIESPIKKREYISLSDTKTSHTFSSNEKEMDIDSTDGDSLFIKLDNGDYSLDYGKIQKNNNFIYPEALSVKKDDNAFKFWKYIDYLKYFNEKGGKNNYD